MPHEQQDGGGGAEPGIRIVQLTPPGSACSITSPTASGHQAWADGGANSRSSA
jgi:hypothetical protein